MLNSNTLERSTLAPLPTRYSWPILEKKKAAGEHQNRFGDLRRVS